MTKVSWKRGDAYCGTALEAINYALDSELPELEIYYFLEYWRQGDLSHFPEFKFEAKVEPSTPRDEDK